MKKINTPNKFSAFASNMNFFLEMAAEAVYLPQVFFPYYGLDT